MRHPNTNSAFAHAEEPTELRSLQATIKATVDAGKLIVL
jgi:hypothetical protein